MPTCGVVYVHSTPLAVCQHVEWAIARVLTAPVTLHWTAQPVDPGMRRSECSWTGRPGTGAELAAALRQWPMIRFEVTEEPSPGVDGDRFMHVPGRGLFRGTIGASGDIQIGEDRLRSIMASARAPEALSHALEKALGTAWDAELEPYRYAGDGAPVTLLTRVG
ncbi:DUF3145 domain-containing protein [Pseudosporangium ferrugineum]|nr:DUF3145 domain-containing protein [Pseudosporangium ferrugineum]